jgi:hypothetical protein
LVGSFAVVDAEVFKSLDGMGEYTRSFS